MIEWRKEEKNNNTKDKMQREDESKQASRREGGRELTETYFNDKYNKRAKH